jgi:hypothetical protein
MTYDQPPGGAPPDNGRGRKAPTIDLKATDISETSLDASANNSTDDPVRAQSEPRQGESLEDSNKSSNDGVTPPPGEESSSETAHPAEQAKRSFPWASLAAGAVAGAAVSAAILLAFPTFLPDRNEQALAARVASVETAIRNLPSQSSRSEVERKTVDDLASRVAKLETTPRGTTPQAPDEASANRLSRIEGEIKALGESVAGLDRRTENATIAAREARQRAEAATAASADRSAAAADPEARKRMERELASLTSRMAALEAGQKDLQAGLAKQAGVEKSDPAARMAASATALDAAVEQGRAFAPELAAVKSLGADPKLVAILEPFSATGVPSSASLAQELSALKPALLASIERETHSEGFLDKLQANAGKLVRIQPLGDAAGNDPATAVAQADLKAGKGDLSGAAVELKGLAGSAPAPARAWIDKTQARAAAIDAARKLAASALAGLSK